MPGVILTIFSDIELSPQQEVGSTIMNDVDIIPRQGFEALTPNQIKSIQRRKLSSFDEVCRFDKRSNLFSIELGALNIDELETGEGESPRSVCCLCIEEIKVGEYYKVMPRCDHIFHADCIDTWLLIRASCPLCRGEILVDES